jgi:hypothetical protein
MYFNFFERGEQDGEQMKIISKIPESSEPPIVSEGIITGVVRGKLDSANPPIYSSRALLYKMPTELNFYVDQFDISKLAQYCFYSDKEDFSDIPSQIEGDLKGAIRCALGEFIAYGITNADREGQRIIVR